MNIKYLNTFKFLFVRIKIYLFIFYYFNQFLLLIYFIVINNNSTEICSISSYEFAFVKIAEDLSWIFVGSRRDNTKNFE